MISSGSVLFLIFSLTVAGPPSKPKGPLDISDVKANGCKLKWKKPEDDGGMPVDHYEVSLVAPGVIMCFQK